MSGSAALPVQSLSELSNVCLIKLKPALELNAIRREVDRLYAAFEVISLTAPVVTEALRGVYEHRLSYYDAQIWAPARLSQIPVVLSEDFNSGAILESVSFLNPLDPIFDPRDAGRRVGKGFDLLTV